MKNNPQSITFRTGGAEDGIRSRYLSSKCRRHCRPKLSVHSTHRVASCRPSRRWSSPNLFTDKSVRFTCRFPDNHSLYNCKVAHTQLMIYIKYTRVGTLIVANIYLQLLQNRYMFRSFTVLQCSHQHCVQPVASDVEVVGYI